LLRAIGHIDQQTDRVPHPAARARLRPIELSPAHGRPAAPSRARRHQTCHWGKFAVEARKRRAESSQLKSRVMQPETISATVVAAMDPRHTVVAVIDNVLGLSVTQAILGGNFGILAAPSCVATSA
jgi:hypothetical protein